MTIGTSLFALPPNSLDQASIREIIASLCNVWEKDNSGGADFRGELGPARAVAIHTHAHHAVRMARTLLIVDDATEGAETAPIVRLILECAVTAAWLLLTDGSGESMIRKGSEERKKALQEIAGLGMDVDLSLQEALAKIDELEEAGVSKAWVFEQHCKALQDGGTVYALYRVLSAESHAGLRIADLYCVADEHNPIGVTFAGDLPDEARVSSLGIAASLLFVAINADEIARARPHRTTQLAKIARKLGVGTRIMGANGFEFPPR